MKKTPEGDHISHMSNISKSSYDKGKDLGKPNPANLFNTAFDGYRSRVVFNPDTIFSTTFICCVHASSMVSFDFFKVVLPFF